MNTYLEQLKERLVDHEIDQRLLNRILNNYKNKLEAHPEKLKDVAEEVEDVIKKNYLRLVENHKREISSVIALAPFISFILYLILSFGFDLWHPGWLVFIAVPLVILVFDVFEDDIVLGFLALIPFLIIGSYLFVGFYFGLWHPTWLVFMLLPVIGVFSRYKKRSIKFMLYTLSPFVTLSAYIILGSIFHLWSSLWVVFLLVPMLACLEEENKKRLIICETTLLISMIIGIVVPLITSSWSLSFLGLLLPIFAMMSMGEESIIRFNKDTLLDILLFLSLAIIYVTLGVLINAWAYAWMILMIVPAYEIVHLSPNHFKFYYIMPFISIAIFFSLGFFFSLWAYSWLAFLLIPILILIERD